MTWLKTYPFIDTSNGDVNVAVLTRQIEDAALGEPLESVSADVAAQLIFTRFANQLSAADETALDAIVAAHVGLVFVKPVLRIEDLPDTTDDSGNFVTKLTGTVPAGGLTPGEYQITMTCEIRCDAVVAGSGVEAQLLIDGANVYEDNWDLAQWHTFCAVGSTTFKAGDTPTATLRFRRIGAPNPAHIRSARLALILEAQQ